MSSPQAPTTTTQIQKTELPAWVDAASQGNYKFAEQVANRPFQQYQGDRVAGQSPLEAAAAGTVAGGQAAANGLYGQAGASLGALAGGVQASSVQAPTSFLGVNMPGAAPTVANAAGTAPVQNAGGYQAVSGPAGVADVGAFGGSRDVAAPGAVGNVQARSFLDANLDGYMNPFTQSVIDTTRASSMRDESTALQRNSDANRASGAWGGSRDAISNAVLQSEGIRNRAATEANLRSSAFTNAQGQINTDNASALQAMMANQQKDITGNAQNIQVGGMNQSADTAKGQLNAQIGQSNQNSALQTQAQNQQAALANQQSFLQANAQDIGVQQGNQAATQATQALNANIGQGNQSAALTNSAQRIGAQTANQNAGLNLAGLSVDAQKANAANQLTGANIGLQAGTALGSLGDSVTNSAGKNALLQSQLGQNERAVNQAGIDANMQKFQEQYQAPLEALNTRLAALGMSPYGKSTSSTGTQSGGTSSNTGMQVLGGAMSILPFLFSDRDTKKDIKRIGKVEGTDLNKYEYKYKKGFMGRDMDEPAVGLMADDVRKKVPGAVKSVKVKGKSVDVVDYGRALANAKPRPFMGRGA